MSNVFCIKTGVQIESRRQAEQEPTAWSYAGIRERLEARFGGQLPKHFAKCMSKPQRQPYMHGDTTNVKYRIKKQGEIFNSPMPVPSEVTPKSCLRIDGVYMLGADCLHGTDEPLPWMDNKYRVTLNFLKSLPNGAKIQIRTRSDLIAHDDYIDELRRLDAWVQILYLSADEAESRDQEPGAPSYECRRQANMRLNQHGIASTMKRVNPKSFELVG